MLDRLFLAHPRSVDESYGEHFGVATRFGLLMLLAGLGTIVHGVVPGWFTRTGSNMIKRLYGEMLRRQPDLTAHVPAYARDSWQIDYEI